MNNNQQNNNDNNSNNPTQIVPPVNSTQVVQEKQVSVPVAGSLNKEAQMPVSSQIEHSEKMPVLDKEVKEAGVEVISDKPDLRPEHEDIGIRHSLENNIPEIEPNPVVRFPLTNDQMAKAEKKRDVQSSAFWLQVLINKIKKVLLEGEIK